MIIVIILVYAYINYQIENSSFLTISLNKFSSEGHIFRDDVLANFRVRCLLKGAFFETSLSSWSLFYVILCFTASSFRSNHLLMFFKIG